MGNNHCVEGAISALEKFYLESGRERTMEYTYGFMDALGVVREYLKGNRPDIRIIESEVRA